VKLNVYTLGNVAQIYFGPTPVELDKYGEHFEEDLCSGQCSLGFKNNETARAFNKYGLACMQHEDCPEIIEFANLWVFGKGENLANRKVKALGSGKYEIDVSGNDYIAELLEDPDFKKIAGNLPV
jgi:hypothetical protein